jgi:CBS domain-containing protein
LSAVTLVRDLMRPPVVAPEGMWFREMVRLIRDQGTECLLVIDAEGGLVGVVTEEDLLLKVMRRWVESRPATPESAARQAERRKAAGVTARELMSEPVLTVEATLPALEAGSLMRQRDVRHLAVVDHAGRPVGVVDRGDLLTVLLRPDEEVRQDVEDLLARRLRASAGAVDVRVLEGVVVLERRRDLGLRLEDLVPDIEAVEGVVAVHPVGEPAEDRGRWPGP